MSVPLDSLVGELQIVAGARQSTTPATAVFTAPRRAARGRTDDMLYALADLSGDISSGDLHTLFERVSSTYWATPGSVTAALRAAVVAAGEWLMDHNAQSALEARWTGGLVCAVLRGADAYLAQAGATLAFIAHERKLEQYPGREAEPMPALGTTRAVDIRLAHTPLQPSDMLLLCDSRFLSRASLEAITTTLNKPSVDEALLNLERLAGSGDLIALIVQATPATAVTPGQAATAPVSAAVAATLATSIPPAPSVRSEPGKPAPDISGSVTQAPPVDSGPIIRVAGRPTRPPTPTAAPQPVATAAPAQPAGTAAKPAVSPAPAPAAKSQPKTSFSLQVREWVEAMRRSARRSVDSVSTAGQLVAQRTLPDPMEVERKKKQDKRNNAVMLTIVIAIPIIVALLVMTVYTQRGAQAAVETHVAEAQNDITLAQQAVTGAETRKYYAQAVDEAQLALQGAPDHETARKLLEQAQTELDKLDNVTRVTATTLWDFKAPGPQHLTAQGTSLYAADRTAGRISRMILTVSGDKLEADPETLLNPGVAVDGKLPGTLIDIVATESSANRQASDIIVPHTGGLLDYNLSFGLKTLDFGSNSLAPDTRRVRSYEGNLYVLDTAKGQIWRYKPSGENYPNPPEPYLSNGLTLPPTVTDMAIDGDVYVTTANGQILKYTQGQTGTFQIKGLGQPLQQPTLITVDPNAQDSSVYVFDQATSRILQFRPDGLFVRQFRADGPAFANVQDLVVDEQNNRLYVISQGVLSTALLPSLH